MPATLKTPARARENSARPNGVRQRNATVPPLFREAVETCEDATPTHEVVTSLRMTFTPEVSEMLMRKAGECGVTPYQMVNAIIGDHLEDYDGFVRPEDDYMSPQEEEYWNRKAFEAEKNDTGKRYSLDEVKKIVKLDKAKKTATPFKIKFCEEALKELREMPKSEAAKIMNVVEQRLAVDPFNTGKPLRQTKRPSVKNPSPEKGVNR